jgi:hypothetical protein
MRFTRWIRRIYNSVNRFLEQTWEVSKYEDLS